MNPPRKKYLLAILSVAVLPGTCMASSAEPRWATVFEAHAGSDVAGEQFRATDKDTTELTADAFGQLRIISSGEMGSWEHIGLDSRLTAGLRSLRFDIRGNGAWRPSDSKWETSFDGVLTARQFHGSGSDSRSSYVEASADATTRVHLPFHLAVAGGFSNSIQGIRYSRTSPVYLDALRHWHGVLAEEAGARGTWNAKGGLEHEIVPDSSALSFWGVSGDMFAMYAPGTEWLASGGFFAAYRRFGETGTHPDEGSGTAHALVTRRLNDAWGLEGVSSTSFVSYQEEDSVYASTRGSEIVVEARWEPGVAGVRCGAGAGLQRSPTSRSDEYSELFLQSGFNLTSRRAGYTDLTVRAGKRKHRYPAEALASDYWFADFTVLVSGAVLLGVTTDAFAVFRSEQHAVSSENTRSLLLTVDFSRAIGGRAKDRVLSHHRTTVRARQSSRFERYP